MKSNSLNIVERVTAPTPKWFKIIRTIGITLTAVGGAILTAPVALPTTIVTVAGYVLLGGTVATAIAQTAMQTEDNEPKDKQDPE
ncbi:hypothetical protein Lbys_1052 [Leadbetterella byssophila DSM 17132]|uniref:Holin n=1 Tax=Leadbetterella byssophila (strain DSM 17132 / JCM 16389 / KACC 11308 / NBRC 106382 / 4M15) TaxID=649349 RepID=E4RST9_LEAB4|nr:hypothetical protein [Leadbetterella byssophila]ADQ16778.1 hypothetical protein Lbys_1052 [Leadbetterella byssophila DSM 17132]